MEYLMELCEMCQQPIGYQVSVTDNKRPIHAACLDKADLKERGFVPFPKRLCDTQA
jgi:hypothetical protein